MHPQQVFHAERVSAWLKQLMSSKRALRVKAVLRTNEGWWGFNYTPDMEQLRPSSHRRDSRLEIIFGADDFDQDELESTLRDCLIND